jgi:hypothetical protein
MLDAQDEGISQKGRRASDRGAYIRFSRSVSDAELTRFIKTDYQAEMFTYEVNEDAVTKA